eukprot:scaffold54251_cov60-Phaeocystis_antarctica.AAC.4
MASTDAVLTVVPDGARAARAACTKPRAHAVQAPTCPKVIHERLYRLAQALRAKHAAEARCDVLLALEPAKEPQGVGLVPHCCGRLDADAVTVAVDWLEAPLGEGVELALECGWDVEQRVGSDARLLGPALLLAFAVTTLTTVTALGPFAILLLVLKLLRGGNAGLAVAVVAAVLPRVAVALIVIFVLLVRPPLALLALLLTSLVLILLPLGRPVESEGLDERRRPSCRFRQTPGRAVHSKTGLERLTQGVPLRVGDQALADAGLAQAERAARCAGCALEQPVEGTGAP